MESFEIELQGAAWTLQVKEWPYEVGRPWLGRMVRVLGGLAATAPKADATEHIAIGELLDKIDEDMLNELVDECERQTVCVGPDKKAVPFSKLRPLLRARYDVTIALVVRHVRVNFAPSFASLGSALTDLAGGAAAEEEAGT